MTWESLAKGIGFVLGYLEGTIFNADWWLGKWDAVRGWAEEKWEAFAEIWENVKGTILDTIFSGDWWLGKWGDVKGWTEEKWEKMESVWENAKKTIKSTLFSKEWWSDQWGAVRKWADDALSGIAKRWDIIKESFAGGRAAGRQAAEAKQYATGGILTRPHLGLVAEAGPEAVIPLATGMRPKALKLWVEAGKMLGVNTKNIVANLAEYRNIKAYTAGGFAGALQALPTAVGWGNEWEAPVAATSTMMPGLGATVNLNFDLAGLVGQVVIENKDDIEGSINKITSAIADNLRSVFQNMVK